MAMFELFTRPESWAAIATLTLLEIVLAIDNIVFIAILSGKLPPDRQAIARKIGLSLALIMRIFLLLTLSWIIRLEKPLFELAGFEFSGRSLIMLAGGLFLIAKATIEIYRKIELLGAEVSPGASATTAAFGLIIFQIALMDMVFSLESVITAVGMVREIPLMITAIAISIIVMMIFADPVSEYVNKHSSLKILALSFLLLIGVLLVAEGTGYHMPRGYVYFAMGFSLMVEFLNMRYRRKQAAY